MIDHTRYRAFEQTWWGAVTFGTRSAQGQRLRRHASTVNSDEFMNLPDCGQRPKLAWRTMSTKRSGGPCDTMVACYNPIHL